MKSKIITDQAEIREVEKEDILEEFQDDEKLPAFDPFAAYDDLHALLYDSLIGYCQMISRGIPPEYNPHEDIVKREAQSNKAGGIAFRRCLKHLKNQQAGTPYLIQPDNPMPSLADYYEHNIMVFLSSTIEPRIPERLRKSEAHLIRTSMAVLKKLVKLTEKA